MKFHFQLFFSVMVLILTSCKNFTEQPTSSENAALIGGSSVESSSYWNGDNNNLPGLTPLNSGNDLYFAHYIGASYLPENEDSVEHFLKLEVLRFQSFYSQNKQHKIALIDGIIGGIDFFAIEPLISRLESSGLFLNVRPLNSESGNGLSYAHLPKAELFFSNPDNPNPEETEENLSTFVTEYFENLTPGVSISLIDRNGYSFKYEIEGLRNSLAPGYNYWEQLDLRLSLSPRFESDGLVVHIYFDALIAPSSSRKPKPTKYEYADISYDAFKKFGDKMAVAIESRF